MTSTFARWRGVDVIRLALGGAMVLTLAASLAPRAAAAGDGSAVTSSVDVTRQNLLSTDGGATYQEQQVDTRHVSLTVAQTTNLRSRQEVSVNWSGAHPTAGQETDPNAANAELEEYPMVLMECRGTPSTLTPQTCWTQSPQERYVDNYNTADPVYRQDQFAPDSERQAFEHVPSGALPNNCASGAQSAYWLHFTSVDGTDFPGGPSGCPLTAPEETITSTSLRPGNTAYAATKLDGTGSYTFEMWTSEDNASLGCTDSIACTLVAVPIMGISCDSDAHLVAPADSPTPASSSDASACQATGKLTPGESAGSLSLLDVDRAVTGSLWWSASNWRGRISIPLSFAPLANVCDLVTNEPEVDVYGSELMTQAMQQWSPHFCLSQGFKVKHVETEEPQARNLLTTGQVEAGFTSDGPAGGYSAPTVSPPVAVSGFAVGYQADDANGDPVSDLKLDPRLLAKLLTESYPVTNDTKADDVALAQNPLNISDDPEFQALNPSIPAGSVQVSSGTLIFLSSDSDVVRAMTSYILADPEARQWLDGIPDPWGTTVNPNYRIEFPEAQLTLPTYTWPLLDTFERQVTQSINPCLADDPVPFLPLVAAPQQRLSTLAQDLQYDNSTAQTVCSQPTIGSPVGEKLNAFGREPKGHRLLFSITDLGDAARYGLPVASLESTSTVSSSAKITDASGRTFVNPTDDALRAAVATATPDDTTGVFEISASTLRTVPTAYPGTMVLSMSVPTSGLPAADAAEYASFLNFTAGTGQQPGLAQGQLPPGYLPMTATNGLGAFVAHTQASATAVQQQSGAVPPLEGVPAALSTSTGSSPIAGPPAAASGRSSNQSMPRTSKAPAPTTSPAALSPLAPAPAAVTPSSTSGATTDQRPSGGSNPTESAATSPATVNQPATAQAAAYTTGTSVGWSGAIIPLLLLTGVVGGGAAVVAGRRGTGDSG